MVGCDDCGDWYYLKCINVMFIMVKMMYNYICLLCIVKSGKASVFSLDTYCSVYRINCLNVMFL